MPNINWYEDNRPKYDGSWVTIDSQKFPTITIDKVQRFRTNRVVRMLLDSCRGSKPLKLNDIWILAENGAFCKEEMQEFYRLIGYSVCGFEEVFEDAEMDSSFWQKETQ